MKSNRLRRLPRLILTAGDIRGIGPEIIAKSVSHSDVRQWAEYLVIGPFCAFSGEKISQLFKDCSLEPADIDPARRAGKSDIVIWKVSGTPLEGDEVGSTGKNIPEEVAGRWAGESITTAVRLIEAGEGDALVTAPIEKKALVAGGFPYPGHTEFLQDLTGSQRVTMVLAGGMLRVSFVTTHIPYNEVRGRLIGNDIEGTVQQTIHGLRDYFNISSPRIALCGLNPHTGEGGLLGEEEREIIKPVVDAFRRRDLDVSGPYPADTIFTRAVAGEYDLVVAMYHDQGLGPFKLYSFGRGVNLTLGLPFVRTSPDHGTGMDISGRGMADERSMIHAIRRAKEIFLLRGG